MGCHHAIALALALQALLGAAGVAHAQVNTERLRVGDSEPGLAGGLGAGLSLKRGNVDFIELTGHSWSRYRLDIHTFLLHARGAIGEQDDDRFSSNAFAHVRWTGMWHPRVGSEVFAQLEYDALVRLQWRSLVGTGPRFVLIQAQDVELFAGTGWMIEYEELDIPVTDPHPRETVAHRWTNYLTLRVQAAEVLQMVHAIYIQPRFDDFEDFRVLGEVELKVSVSEMLALTTTARLRHDSRPPSEVERTDLVLQSGFELRF